MRRNMRCTTIPKIAWSILLCLVFYWNDASAQPTQQSPDMDGGGEAFTLTCGTTRVLVGITGGAGDWVNRVRGICVEINARGEWISPETQTSATASTSGNDFTLKCPLNHAVVALSGRSGRWLDMLQVHCRFIGDRGDTSGQLILAKDGSTTSVGGTGGTMTFGPLECGMHNPARSIVGSKGNFLGTPTIDRIGLDCPQADVFAVSRISWPLTITVGSAVTAMVEFDRAAPTMQIFGISGSGTVVSVPATAAVSAGSKRREFEIRTLRTGCAMIAVTYANIIHARGVMVQPERPTAYPLYLNTPDMWIYPDHTATGEFASSASPGTIISLQSSDPGVVSVPSTLVVSSTDKRQFAISAHKSGCAEIVASVGNYRVRRIVSVMTVMEASGRDM